MELRARINGIDYPVANGAVFTEELSETLDSGTIVLPHISGELDLKPYDDVIVYSGTLATNALHVIYPYRGLQVYHHMLVDKFVQEQVDITGNYYNYTIDLFSETKGLEVVQMPNRTITQPRAGSSGTVRTVWNVMSEYVQTYSPWVKVLSVDSSGNPILTDGKYTWVWQRKYFMDGNFRNYFQNPAPETQFNLPTLRQAITQLSLTKDYIPIVKDNVISFVSLADRTGTFSSITGHSWTRKTMDSESYCDRLRRGYSNALSKDTTAHFVEKMGFRNSDSSTMTFANMRLEFTHPIYRISKVNMCYYKSVTINSTTKYFLCKQDISKLVLQNATRNLLSEDWQQFGTNPPSTMEAYYNGSTKVYGLSDYKFCTVGYDIGSKYITGWGTTYTYPTGWWKTSRSYIENIMNVVDEINPMGDISDNTATRGTVIPAGEYSDGEKDKTQYIQSPAHNPDGLPDWLTNASTGFVTTYTQKLKSMFFEIEYEGFIDGAVVISKDYHDGSVVKNDNSSSPLAIVETDGIFEKEKANRLGNSVVVINARLNSLQQPNGSQYAIPLGMAYQNGSSDPMNDTIIYKRTFAYNEASTDIVYYGCKDYVLKNYFTSVYSKNRPYALASYGQSVLRSENRTLQLLFSTDTALYQTSSNNITFSYYGTEQSTPFLFVSNIVSFFKPSSYDDNTQTYYSQSKINYSLIGYGGNTYCVDYQSYNSGYALCFDATMPDNVSAGVHITTFNPEFGDAIKAYLEAGANALNSGSTERSTNDITGSLQDWYMIADDSVSGQSTNLSFSSVSIDRSTIASTYYENSLYENIPSDTIYGSYLMPSPKNNISSTHNTLELSSSVSVKDGKERISMTHEIEPISDTTDIQFSEWLMKLSDLMGNYRKLTSRQPIKGKIIVQSASGRSAQFGGSFSSCFTPLIAMYIPNAVSPSDMVGYDFGGGLEVDFKSLTGTPYDLNSNVWIIFHSIIASTTDEISISATTYWQEYDALLQPVGNPLTEDITVVMRNMITEKATLDAQYENTSYVYTPWNSWYISAQKDGYRGYSYSMFKVYRHFQESGVDVTEEHITSASNGIWLNPSGYMTQYERSIRYEYVSNVSTNFDEKNLQWYLAPYMTPSSKFDTFSTAPSGYTAITPTVQVQEQISPTRKPIELTIGLSSSASSAGSVRCYYYDEADSLWHFVYGQSIASGAVGTSACLSLVDDRSRTVLNPATGEKWGKTKNYYGASDYGVANFAVKG